MALSHSVDALRCRLCRNGLLTEYGVYSRNTDAFGIPGQPQLHKERRLLYVHFLMTDNTTLSPRTLEKYRNMYTGVFARRFILGEWSVADGVIYSMFDREKNVRDEVSFTPEREFIAVDYGTFNPCVFLHFFASGSGDGM